MLQLHLSDQHLYYLLRSVLYPRFQGICPICQGVCSCDERCRILGDCCVDAPRECFGAENDSVDNYFPGDDKSWAESHQIRDTGMGRSLWFVWQTSYLRTFMDYRFISRCPKNVRGSEACEFHFKDRTLSRMLPVCHPASGLLFNNRYCAACHGFNVEDTVSFYGLIPVCGRWLTLNHTRKGRLENSAEAYELYNLCSVEFSNFPPTEYIVSTLRNRLYDMFGYDDIRSPCSTFMDPVVKLADRSIAKNIHCFPKPLGRWNTVACHCFYYHSRVYIAPPPSLYK